VSGPKPKVFVTRTFVVKSAGPVQRLIGTGVYELPGAGETKLPQPAIVFDPVVPGAKLFGEPYAGLELACPERFTVPVVMLYGVPAERIRIGLTVIACFRFSDPNRKSRYRVSNVALP